MYYPSSEQQRCWSDCVDAQADQHLCCSHRHKTGFLMTWLNRIIYQAAWTFLASRSCSCNLTSPRKTPGNILPRTSRDTRESSCHNETLKRWEKCIMTYPGNCPVQFALKVNVQYFPSCTKFQQILSYCTELRRHIHSRTLLDVPSKENSGIHISLPSRLKEWWNYRADRYCHIWTSSWENLSSGFSTM